jgi:dihydrofolate synthase/folylpolyglutamate synthase
VAMAFDYFRFQKVDIACIEVGLGGRLDSTNIINPILSIITNIGFDHMAILGNSLDAIAFEKAGIIKSNTPVIIGEKQEKSVQNVFEEKANLTASKILWAENEFSISENNSFYEMENKEIKVYINKLYFGASYHQINIRTVLSAYAYLQKNQLLDLSNHPEIISKGIENFYKNTHFMGRWMPHPKRSNVFFETAHNEDGIRKLNETISNYSYQNLYIIFGAVNDKDVETVSKLLPQNANYIITQADVPRALDAKTLSQIFISQGQKVIFDFPIAQEAYNKGIEIIKEDDLLIITGSTFLVGEILKNEQSNFL